MVRARDVEPQRRLGDRGRIVRDSSATDYPNQWRSITTAGGAEGGEPNLGTPGMYHKIPSPEPAGAVLSRAAHHLRRADWLVRRSEPARSKLPIAIQQNVRTMQELQKGNGMLTMSMTTPRLGFNDEGGRALLRVKFGVIIPWSLFVVGRGHCLQPVAAGSGVGTRSAAGRRPPSVLHLHDAVGVPATVAVATTTLPRLRLF